MGRRLRRRSDEENGENCAFPVSSSNGRSAGGVAEEPGAYFAHPTMGGSGGGMNRI